MTIRFIGPLLLCGAVFTLVATTDVIAETRGKKPVVSKKPGTVALQIKNIPTGPGDDIKIGRGSPRRGYPGNNAGRQ